MADAKIMTFGELFSPTIDVIPDNKAAAVEIEGLDGNDYIKINTTNGSEAVQLVSSGTGNAGVGAWTEDYGAGSSPPSYPLSIHGTGAEVGGDILEVRSTGTDLASGIAIRADTGNPRIRFQILAASKFVMGVDADDSQRFKISKDHTLGGTDYLIINRDTGDTTLTAGLNVANTAVLGTDAAAIGQSAQAGGTASVALGRLNNSSGAYGVTAGSGLTASGVKSSAFGIDCSAAHHSSLALGFKANTAFIQSLAMVGTPAAGMGGAQTMMCVGTVETTDASETYLDTSDGSEDLEIFSSPGIAKSQVIQIEATILSICSSASGAYAVDDFVSRKYNFAIQYTYNSAVAGFIGTSNTGISTGGSMNGSREHVFTDDASGIGSASAGTGIDDKLYFATSTNKVSVKISVTGGEASATVRHVAHITAKTITMD